MIYNNNNSNNNNSNNLLPQNYLYNTVESFYRQFGIKRTALHVFNCVELFTHLNQFRYIPGTYGIYNPVDGKYYIGSTVNLAHRLNQHLFSYSKNSRNSNVRLQKALDDFGRHNFQFIIFETLSPTTTNKSFLVESLHVLELALFNSILNRQLYYNFVFNPGSSKGYVPTEAQRKKLQETARYDKDNIASKPTLVEDLETLQTYHCNTIKAAASIVGCSVDSIYKVVKRKPPIYNNRWRVTKVEK